MIVCVTLDCEQFVSNVNMNKKEKGLRNEVQYNKYSNFVGWCCGVGFVIIP